MIVTYGDVARLGGRPGESGALSKLGNLSGDDGLASSMPVAERYRIMRFVKVLAAELATYVRLFREIGERYGVAGEAPSGFASFTVRAESIQAFEGEKAKLDAMECESLASLKPLPVATYEKVALTPRDLECLEPFVVQPSMDE